MAEKKKSNNHRTVGGFSGYPISDRKAFPDAKGQGRDTMPKAKWVKNASSRKP